MQDINFKIPSKLRMVMNKLYTAQSSISFILQQCNFECTLERRKYIMTRLGTTTALFPGSVRAWDTRTEFSFLPFSPHARFSRAGDEASTSRHQLPNVNSPVAYNAISDIRSQNTPLFEEA